MTDPLIIHKPQFSFFNPKTALGEVDDAPEAHLPNSRRPGCVLPGRHLTVATRTHSLGLRRDQACAQGILQLQLIWEMMFRQVHT